MKIDKFTRGSVRLISGAMRTELEALAEKYGLTVKVGGGTFDATSYRPKVEFALRDASGLVLDQNAQAFRANAELYGFEPDDLGRTFRFGRDEYRIVGLNTRAPKNPVLLEKTATGSRHKAPEGPVLQALGRKGQPTLRVVN